MRFSTTSVFVILFVLVCFSSIELKGQEVVQGMQGLVRGETSIPKSEIADHASIYEAFLSNMLAWESGDFLVKIVKLDDSTNRSNKNGDLVIEATTTFRIRFDHKNKRYLCLRQREHEYLLIAHPKVNVDSIKKKGITRSGFAMLNEQTTVLQPPRGVQRIKKTYSAEELFSKFRIPEFRSAGLVTAASGGSMSHIKKLIPRLASGHDVTEASHTAAGNLKFIRRAPVPGGGGQFFVTHAEFDSDTFMPVVRNLSVDVESNGERKVVPDSKERVSWKKINGVCVPTALSKERKDGRSIGGHMFPVDQTLDMEFKWISLNAEMDDEDFDAELLKDFDNLLQFDDEESGKEDEQ